MFLTPTQGGGDGGTQKPQGDTKKTNLEQRGRGIRDTEPRRCKLGDEETPRTQQRKIATTLEQRCRLNPNEGAGETEKGRHQDCTRETDFDQGGQRAKTYLPKTCSQEIELTG